MTQESLSPEKSLTIIQTMIQEAKKRYQAVNIFFLIWGWLLFFSGIAFYILVHEFQYEHPYMVWIIQGVIGGIVSSIVGSRQSKGKTMTFLDKVISYTWIAYVFALVLIIFANVYNQTRPEVDIMLLTGVPTMLTGIVIRFKPLIVGAVMFWITGIITLLFVIEYSELMFSLAILLGYLIPGYLLKKREKNSEKEA